MGKKPSSSSEDGEGYASAMGDGRERKEKVESLEKLFATVTPEVPRIEVQSEGLGRGTLPRKHRLQMKQQNLDLQWRMTEGGSVRSVCCRECAGTGLRECRFCAGTGLLKVGEDLMTMTEHGGRIPACPVCQRGGEEKCKRCNGSGRLAGWLFNLKRQA
ncbi:unnamed protein product [Discosporangium mesarthrocarpum]